MTDREKAIVSAYTGYTMLAHEKLSVFYEYVEEKLGRPIMTHHLAMKEVWDELHEKSKDDFISLCAKMDEKEKYNWIILGNGEYKCPKCGDTSIIAFKKCNTCGARMDNPCADCQEFDCYECEYKKGT